MSVQPLTPPFRARARAIGLIAAGALMIIGSTGCARVMQDEIGVKRKYGAVQDQVLYPGLRGYNPFNSRIFKVKTRTINLEIEQGLPSREGLTVRSEISILYRIRAEDAPDLLRRTGMNFEPEVILPVFRSAAADVCARFYAKDMHSASRRKIEEEIQQRMIELVSDRGFIIEAVLLKSVILPQGLSAAIEDKLQAEQIAQRMEFELQRESSEAQRVIISAEARRKTALIAAEAGRDARIVEAEGIKQATRIRAEGTAEANEVINNSISPNVLKYRQIEAFHELARSSNSKVIITDGKTPVLNVAQ